MGSPLELTLANTFLCFHEKTWLPNCRSEFYPIKYILYVDDCFVVFKCKQHAEKFLKYIEKCSFVV